MIIDSGIWENVCLLQDLNQLLQCRNRVKKKTKKNLQAEGEPVGNEICYFLHTCWSIWHVRETQMKMLKIERHKVVQKS